MAFSPKQGSSSSKNITNVFIFISLQKNKRSSNLRSLKFKTCLLTTRQTSQSFLKLNLVFMLFLIFFNYNTLLAQCQVSLVFVDNKYA